MDSSIKYQFLMSQLTHVRDIKDTEKTKLSLVLYAGNQNTCILRECKNRDLSAVCESLRKIRNPGTAVIYDYVYNNGNTYILEENLSGKTVQEYLEEEKIFSEKETAQIVVALCKALEELHGENPPVVHNDINPSNIMLREDGSVKLFDFDIARLYKDGAEQNTVLFGTEEYAAPEHYGYGQSEPRTDIYCLGATMHKMLTGVKLSSEHRITYKGKLQKVLKRCLQFDPQNRYATVKALRKDLERFLHRKKKGFLWMFVSIGILLLLLLGGYVLKQETKPTPVNPALQGTQTVQTTGEQDTEPGETTTPQEPEDTTPPPNQGEAQQPEPSEPPKDLVEDTPPPNQTQTPGGNSTPPQTDENQENPVTPPQNEDTPVKNDTRENANLLQLGQTYSETIEEDCVPDWWKFTTARAKGVYIIVVDCSVANPVNGQTVACLYDSEGNELKTLTVGYKEKERFMDVVLEPGKEYYIKVTGVNTEAPALGDYRLEISEYGYTIGTEDPWLVRLMLNTPCLSIDYPNNLEEQYVFSVMKTGKYKIEICNREDYEIHFYGDYPKQYYFEERVGAGETVSFTFNALQGVEFCIGMDCWYPGYDDENGAEYTLLVTYEGEVLEWSEYR